MKRYAYGSEDIMNTFNFHSKMVACSYCVVRVVAIHLVNEILFIKTILPFLVIAHELSTWVTILSLSLVVNSPIGLAVSTEQTAAISKTLEMGIQT